MTLRELLENANLAGLGLLDPASGLSALYSVFAAKADARRTIGLLAVAPVEWQGKKYDMVPAHLQFCARISGTSLHRFNGNFFAIELNVAWRGG